MRDHSQMGDSYQDPVDAYDGGRHRDRGGDITSDRDRDISSDRDRDISSDRDRDISSDRDGDEFYMDER
jgi:hypothetical protein